MSDTSVTVMDNSTTVTVLDDGETVVITTGEVTQATFDALLARVVQLESTNYLVLQDGN